LRKFRFQATKTEPQQQRFHEKPICTNLVFVYEYSYTHCGVCEKVNEFLPGCVIWKIT